ncbi:MAG: MazG nucleotide pyrophosphohydrolase domain-containing protein [Actinomycetota bacterium]
MTDLSEIQELISTIRARRGFTTEPAQLVCLLAEEVGEVAAEVKKTWSPNYPDLVPSELGDELADAFVLISALASSFRIDLETAVRAKFLEVDGARHWASAGEQTPDDEP